MKKGYRIKIFNTINFGKSMHYNPFHYIHSEKDILKLVTTLMTNTRGEGKGGDPFWDKAEKLLLTSLIAGIYYEALEKEQHFATLLEFLDVPKSEKYRNALKACEKIMDRLAEKLSKEVCDLVEELQDQASIARSEENKCHFKVDFLAGLLVQQEVIEQVKKIDDKSDRKRPAVCL